MRKFTLPVVLALSVFSSTANADALGLFIGGGTWAHDPVGSFSTGLDPAPIDMVSDLGYTENSDTYFYAAVEHFMPLVPNVRVEKASLGHTGTTTGTTFNNVGVSGAASIQLDTTDAIVYWRLLDNWVNFDVGLNARTIEGDFIVGAQTVPVSGTVPLLYVNAQIDLPFSGFSVGMDVNQISVSDVTYSDIRVRALYELGVVGFEVGTRTTTLELAGFDAINADLEFKGVMLGVFLHF